MKVKIMKKMKMPMNMMIVMKALILETMKSVMLEEEMMHLQHLPSSSYCHIPSIGKGTRNFYFISCMRNWK